MISGGAAGRIRGLPRLLPTASPIVAASAYAEMPGPDVGAMTSHAPDR